MSIIILIIVSSEENLIGKIKKIKITKINQNTMFGNINKKPNKEYYAA